MTRSRAVSTKPPRDGRESETAEAVRRGRPVGDQAAKRGELLSAAISVIAQYGYAGASVRKVAERAGHSTGAVTYYFENKEGMIAAVTEALFERFHALLEADQDRIDIRAILKRVLDWAQSDTDSWLVLFQLLARARHDAAFATVIQRLYARFRQLLTQILGRGQSEGLVRRDIPADVLADQLSAISDGWMMMFPVEPERFRPDRVQVLLDATIALVTPAANRRTR